VRDATAFADVLHDGGGFDDFEPAEDSGAGRDGDVDEHVDVGLECLERAGEHPVCRMHHEPFDEPGDLSAHREELGGRVGAEQFVGGWWFVVRRRRFAGRRFVVGRVAQVGDREIIQRVAGGEMIGQIVAFDGFDDGHFAHAAFEARRDLARVPVSGLVAVGDDEHP